MRLLKRDRKTNVDPLEERLYSILDLTKGLGKVEFDNLIECVKLIFEVRQKLNKVKTYEEKEVGDIEEIERRLEKEVQ